MNETPECRPYYIGFQKRKNPVDNTPIPTSFEEKISINQEVN